MQPALSDGCTVVKKGCFGDVVESLTGIRSAYFCRMRSASALRFSKGCSSLNLERISVVDMEIGLDGCSCFIVYVDEVAEGFCRLCRM